LSRGKFGDHALAEIQHDSCGGKEAQSVVEDGRGEIDRARAAVAPLETADGERIAVWLSGLLEGAFLSADPT